MSKEGQLSRITPAEAAAKIREGAIAADIRSQAEYRGGHIGGALSLPPERHRDKLPDNTAPCLIFIAWAANARRRRRQHWRNLVGDASATFLKAVCRHGKPQVSP